MAKMMLQGEQYDYARLFGIQAEMWAKAIGRVPSAGDGTFKATGDIITVDNKTMLELDTESEYYTQLAAISGGIHASRLQASPIMEEPLEG